VLDVLLHHEAHSAAEPQAKENGYHHEAHEEHEEEKHFF
jgi:hypothetical protein